MERVEVEEENAPSQSWMLDPTSCNSCSQKRYKELWKNM